MKKYFGTDGIRGKANELLTSDLALKLGKYLGYKFKNENILIAKDPRQSSDMLEHALAAGIVSSGANAYLLGVMPTPALAYVVKKNKFNAGVMISASHNPYYDNGLKFFSHDGLKMNDGLEKEIESYIDDLISLPENHDIGKVKDYTGGQNIYINYVEETVDVRFNNLKIVLDLANGASVTTAYKVFKELGAKVVVMNGKPNGKNINDKAGSTHMSYLQKRVVEEKADMGFAFDGDADRVLACDHKGNLIDGDKILYVLAKSMKEENKLNDNTVVSTIMANLGFIHSMEENGFKVIQTEVGDRHVAKALFDHDYSLGGEQSGHILVKEFGTTGDGVMVALKLAEAVKKSNKSLYDLSKTCKTYPQVLKNITIENKEAVMNHPKVSKVIEELTHQLGDDGRILVRPSGTEPLIRVMAEAKTEKICHEIVDEVIDIIKNL